MKLVHDATLKMEPGNFGAGIKDGWLLVPVELFVLLQRNGVRSAEEAVSWLHTYPMVLAVELHWTLEQVRSARTAFVALLRGHIPDDFLEARTSPPHGVLPKKR